MKHIKVSKSLAAFESLKSLAALNVLKVLRLLPLSLLFFSCLDDDSLEQPDTFMGNFEACWQTLDQHYCFFDEKGVDWQKVHDVYQPIVRDSIKNQYQLFNLLDEMMDHLRDGHVNLYAPFNTARNWSWYEQYPDNFDSNLLDKYYIGTKFWIACGFQYGVFGRDSIAYIRYASFDASFGDTNLDYILSLLRNANGLIIDIRDNGGGALTNASSLASRFAGQKTLYGYMRHKTGTGHREFSSPEPLYVEPPTDRFCWNAAQRPVVVLTNRHCYSSANQFVQIMKSLDGVMTADSLGLQKPAMIKVCGDRTGGGSGMPFESVLPNGWVLRFSACPITDAQDLSTESGIDPSPGLRVDMDSTSMIELHRDDIIEAARAYILQNTFATRAK